MLRNVFIVFILTFEAITGLQLGSPCVVNGKSGECVALHDCSIARDKFIKNGTKPTICSRGKYIIICCEKESGPATVRSSDTDNKNECGPIISLPAPKTGQKAWQKCLEYQERLLHPCEDAFLRPGKIRYNKCNRDTPAIILSSDVAYEGELPHMVLLGYNSQLEENSVRWLCEGVIISERFVVTLAACTVHLDFGQVRYVRTQVIRISEDSKPSNIYQVKTIIRHPSFEIPKPQNDIALLETDTDIVLNDFVIPACLDVGNLPSYERAVASGWDTTFDSGAELKKSILTKAPPSSCDAYSRQYNESVQMCYENKTKKGNHYGHDRVLQEEPIECMYVLTGLENRRSQTTLSTGIPYTRVSIYTPWIESIVWP